jgi:hypothetical protein
MRSPDDSALLMLTGFANSFFYGQRSNLDFKFLADLSEIKVADFFDGLLGQLSQAISDRDSTRLVVTYEHGNVALLTSSRHFVEGQDPRPFGVEPLTQAEAESRISEFLRAEPTLARIPVTTPPDQIRVRHGATRSARRCTITTPPSRWRRCARSMRTALSATSHATRARS